MDDWKLPPDQLVEVEWKDENHLNVSDPRQGRRYAADLSAVTPSRKTKLRRELNRKRDACQLWYDEARRILASVSGAMRDEYIEIGQPGEKSVAFPITVHRSASDDQLDQMLEDARRREEQDLLTKIEAFRPTDDNQTRATSHSGNGPPADILDELPSLQQRILKFL